MASARSSLLASVLASESDFMLAIRLACSLSDALARELSGVLSALLADVLSGELADVLADVWVRLRVGSGVGGVGEPPFSSLSEVTGRAFLPKNSEPAASSFAISSVLIFLLIARTVLE